MTDPDKLDHLLTVLRKHGVTAFQAGDLRIQLGPTAAEPVEHGRQPETPATRFDDSLFGPRRDQ